jgi:hypothetical protein
MQDIQGNGRRNMAGLIPACWAVEPPLTTFLSKVTLLWEGNDEIDADKVGENVGDA